MKNLLRLTSFFFYFVPHKQFICKRQVTQCIRKFFPPKCGAYLRAALKTIVSAAAHIKSPPMRAYLSNYCNLQLKRLLHLGQNVITFRVVHYI